jgi:DNA-binding response OmpR family regulator
LQREIWGKRGGAIRTLDSHASRARIKLRKAGAEDFIVNCHGIGYSLGGRG